jgi:hypothetical protein
MKALVVAQHMHGMIVGHGLKAVGILGLGLLVLFLLPVFVGARRSIRSAIRIIGAVVLGVGAFGVGRCLGDEP